MMTRASSITTLALILLAFPLTHGARRPRSSSVHPAGSSGSQLLQSLEAYEVVYVEGAHVSDHALQRVVQNLARHSHFRTQGREGHEGEVRVVDEREGGEGVDQHDAYDDSTVWHSGADIFNHSVSLEFGFKFDGGTYSALLSQRQALFASNYAEQRWTYRRGKLVSMDTLPWSHATDNCHYTGTLSDVPGSRVTVNTCEDGLAGTIRVPQEGSEREMLELGIAPAYRHLPIDELQRLGNLLQGDNDHHHVGRLHIVYRLRDVLTPEWTCSSGETHNLKSMRPQHTHTHVHADAHAHNTGHAPELQSHHSTYEQLSASDQTHRRLFGVQHYAELLVVNDNARHIERTSQGLQTEQDAASIVAIIAENYDTAPFDDPVRLVLIGQITFVEENPPVLQIPLGTCGDGKCTSEEVGVQEMLNAFDSWTIDEAGNIPEHDNTQLFSGIDFGSNALGYAHVGGMCQQGVTSGIDQTFGSTVDNHEFLAAVITHEMGHNFGMSHDSSNNACPQSGFFMAAVVGAIAPTDFSSCSHVYYNELVDYLNQYGLNCLLNVPDRQYGDPVCGNNFVEEGEECDCGSDDCTTTTDPCCDGATCTFVDGAACSERDSCCSSCQVLEAGLTCRDSVSACDLAEVCDGVHGVCPTNGFLGAGTACDHDEFGAGLCYLGRCMSHLRQCRAASEDVQGGPFDACPTDTQKNENGGEFCGRLWCSASAGACTWFTSSGQSVQTEDGVPCGGGNQCKGNECVGGADLTPDVYWATAPWTPCPSCDIPQARNVTCTRESTSLEVSPQLCPPNSEPETTRQCVNASLGCVHDTSIFGGAKVRIPLFGVEINKVTAIFGMLGVVFFLFVVLACCFKAVTYGEHTKLLDADKERDLYGKEYEDWE